MDSTAPARRMPRRRRSVTQSFVVGDHTGHLTTSLYEDGAVGQIDLQLAKQGSALAGWAESLATAVSLGLQQGVPLEDYVQRLTAPRTTPRRATDDADVPRAASVVDYVARRLAIDHLPVDVRRGLDVLTPQECDPLPDRAHLH